MPGAAGAPGYRPILMPGVGGIVAPAAQVRSTLLCLSWDSWGEVSPLPTTHWVRSAELQPAGELAPVWT